MMFRLVFSFLLALVLLCAGSSSLARAAPVTADASVLDAGFVAADAGADHAIGTSPSLWDVFVERGGQALKAALAVLATVFAWLFARAGLSARWRNAIDELGAHAKDVVLEVFQIYVEEIKAGRVDGKLTEEEKARAKAMALERLRQRLSWSKLLQIGGGVLTRIFAGHEWAKKVEGWLGGAVETAIAEAKREGKAAKIVSSGKDATTPPAESVQQPNRKLPPEPPPLPR